ncbi:uncharacterized protein LOC108911249 isoform X2 [Anoplophora glabripennis]|nr:uncharacterized protein LOC108911249 isoform X2 [Anoplophora glabripennis]XP_023310243.1 uncharacterized protein LOC108911249 isoform X2 [Anoplophora glabripennis]
MVIEFWKKIESTDLIIGLTKIPLHQFYLAYRNPVFVKYLSKNKLPIIDTDWWEPIYSVDTDNIIGQVQILSALGTEEQISNLKSERGFADNIVKAKLFTSQSQYKCEQQTTEKQHTEPNRVYKFKHENNIRDILLSKNRNKFIHNVTNRSSDLNKLEGTKGLSSELEEKDKHNFADKAVNTVVSPKKVFTPPIQKFDVGTQLNLKMDEVPNTQDKDKISPTQEMLGNFLNQLLVQRQKNVFVENSTNTDALETSRSNCSKSLQDAQNNTNLKLRKTTDLLDSLQKALSLDGPLNIKSSEKKPGTFKASIAINSANHLPSRKKCKSKKSRNRSIKNEDNVLPSCYVTFETSENDLKITPVVGKTTNPAWNFKCEENLSVDLLTNGQRRLIFKVWRKATNAVLSPNMQTDVVLGFAAVDLTILLAGFPNVKGWFNIIDFTGKCNGQINIHIMPLEDISKYTLRKEECSCNASTENVETKTSKPEDEPSEVFSRALKRKFTELDEITQRLRLRLSKVTNDDSDSSSDGVAEDFERDINTLCIEEDFDLIDFEEEAKKLNISHSKENEMNCESSTSKSLPLLTIKEKGCDPKEGADKNIISSSNTASSLTQDNGSILGLSSNSEREKELSTLDKHLQEGKQKIDTLLEKLSLISADTNNTFASRYVSGCSLNNDYSAINIDTEAILKELDHSSRPNIQSSLGFEPLRFQQLYGGSCDAGSSKNNSGSSISHTSNSDTSLITNFSDCRPAPDGQGNVLDEKIVKK